MSCHCRFQRTERTGLYIMVFITMVYGCDNNDKLNRIENQLKQVPVSSDVIVTGSENVLVTGEKEE